MKSVMSHQFSQVPRAQIERSQFNRSHGLKTTFDAGWLIPVLVDEALPGDTFNLHMSHFARLATPIKPIMDNMFLESFFFAVPYRLVWDNWQRFNGEQDDPDDSTDFNIPEMTSGVASTYGEMTLSDYLGIPTKVVNIRHSALWHRAYNLIWNTWFRDQNLQDSVVVDKDDADSDPADYVLLRRGKRHDYFTSCLPWPQKGVSVQLPLGTEAPVLGLGAANSNWSVGAVTVYDSSGSNPTYAATKNFNDLDPNQKFYAERNTKVGLTDFPYIRADLSDATAATINELREAFQIQKMYERDARGGTRYIEIIKSHFGVTSPDYRLQRPEYLGGGSTPINIHPIAQQEGTKAGTTPQGNLAAMGVSSGSGHGFVKSFTEHCLILGLVNVRADLTYQQGLNRMFSRSTRFDFYWPSFSHLGEQAVLNKEIYAQGAGATGPDGVFDELVFGYQERYAEYRYKPSMITGRYRSNSTVPLDMWHLCIDFDSLPVLNDEFIQDNPPIDRCIAVPTEPHFLFDAYFNFKAARPMPTYSVPGLIDHF